MIQILHSSVMSRLRMRHRVLVAESGLLQRSPGNGLCSLDGEAGADFMMKHKSFSRGEVAKSRGTVLLGWKENFGMGKERGGGEFE